MISIHSTKKPVTWRNQYEKTVIIAVVIALLISLILLLTNLLLLGYFDRFDNTVDGEFDIMSEEYQRVISNTEFKSDAVIKNYTDPGKMRKEIQRIWINIYGISIRKQQPYEVLFDSESNMWLIRGTWDKAALGGGTANALVDAATGDVVAIWHGC